VFARTLINGNVGPECPALSTQGAVSVAAYSIELTGLTTPGNITIKAQVKDGSGAILASTGTVTLNGFAIFLR
jgi:hypothetical protein